MSQPVEVPPEDPPLSELVDEVHRIEIQSHRLVSGALAGGYRSVFRGTGLEFDETREYVQGDDPRTVDWNVTARVGRPYVKRFVDERDLAVVFVVDTSASMDAGFGAWSGRQLAARVCGALGIAAVQNNDKVGLVAFDHEVRRFVPPKKGLRHAVRMVRDCLALPSAPGTAGLGAGLEFTARVLRRRAIVFLISDFFGDEWQRSLKLCARHHDLIAVRVRSPELTPPRSGLWRLRDPETGRRSVVDWNRASVREAYEARVREWDQGTERILRSAHVDWIDVRSPAVPDPRAVFRPILAFFHMRALRGRRR